MEQGRPDAIFGLVEAHKKDPRPNKVSVAIGAYRDDQGKPWVLPTVRKVRRCDVISVCDLQMKMCTIILICHRLSRYFLARSWTRSMLGLWGTTSSGRRLISWPLERTKTSRRTV